MRNRLRAAGFVTIGVLALHAAGSGCAEGVELDQAAAVESSSTGATGGAGGASPCAADCSSIDTPPCLKSVCNTGMYMGTIGECIIVPDPGATCDDAEFCTIDDTCDEMGQCIGGPANQCGMTPGECKAISCNEESDSCGEVPATEGAPCQDPNNLCLKGSMCTNGSCSGGTVDDCFFFPVSDDCHEAVCDPEDGMCHEQIGNEGDPCTDPTELCTVGKTCVVGVCSGGTAKDCSSLTVGCFNGVCEMATGQCIQQPIMPGQQCAEATDECNIGICDMNGNCNPTPTNENGMCNDFLNCTQGDHCVMGTCTPTTTITQCINNDTCCPMGCNDTNDNDCTYCDWNPNLFPMNYGTFSSIGDMTFDNDCNLYIANDDGNIYKILHNTTNVTSIGTFMSGARGVRFRPQDGLIYVASYDTLYKMTTTGANVQTVIAGLNGYLNGMTVAPSGWGSYGGHLVLSASSGQVYVINPASPSPFVLGSIAVEVSDVEFDKMNNVLYVAAHSQFEVLTLSPSGQFSTYVTTSCEPDGLAVDDGSRLFYSCGCNDQIYKVNIPTPGSPTVVASPSLNCYWAPAGLIYDGLNDLLVMTDTISNYELQAFTP